VSIEDALASFSAPFVSEDDLQRELAGALSTAGFDVKREARLSDGVSRIDLLVGTVGLEVKTDGDWRSVAQQLLRYSRCDEVNRLILVTTRARHRLVSSALAEAPVSVVVLTGGAL